MTKYAAALILLAFLSACSHVGPEKEMEGFCDDEFSRGEELPWASSQKIAIRLPDAQLVGEGPGHSSDIWYTSFGTISARFGVHHPKSWASGVRNICTFDVQGYVANLIAFRKWGRFRSLGVWMPETPYGKGFMLSMPYHDSVEFRSRLLFSLASLTFINNIENLRLLSVGEDERGIFAVVRNEISVDRVVRIGDSVTWNHGVFVGTTDLGIVIHEYDYESDSWRERILGLIGSEVQSD